MSVITLSETIKVARFRWGQLRSDLSFGVGGVFGTQTVWIGHPLWRVSFEAPDDLESDSGEWASLCMNLEGATNQLAMWHKGRPVPRGTMRGTMTLNSSASQGTTTLSIVASGQNGKTLLNGDYLGLGSGQTQQVVMVTSNAASDGSGVISVNIKPPLRNTFLASDPVTWNKPKALFRCQTKEWGADYSAAIVSGFSLQFIEDWRP